MGVTRQIILKRLKAMGMIQKQGNSVPNIHGAKVMLCIWSDQLSVVFSRYLTIARRIEKKYSLPMDSTLNHK